MHTFKKSAFPLACVLLSGVICRGWGTFNAHYLPGVMLLAGGCALLLQQVAVHRWKVYIHGWAATGLLALTIVYMLGAVGMPDVFYGTAALELLVALGCFFAICMFQPPQIKIRQILGGGILWLGMSCFLAVSIQCLQQPDKFFSPDSLFCYLLSKSFSDEFGLVGTVRQYVVPSDYGMSFPYFYPLVVFLVRQITGLEIYAGVLVNLIAAVLTVFALIDLSLQYSNEAWPGQIVSAFMLGCTYYQQEVNGARSIPLALLLALLVWIALTRLFFGTGRWAAALGGLAAGALAVTRFDGVALLVFGGVLILLFAEQRLRAIAAYGIAALLPIIPWSAYSLHHFDTLWATDNAGTALRVETVIPTAVFLPDEEVLTLYNAPGAWFAALWDKFYRVLHGLFTCSLPLATAFGILLVFLAVILLKRRRNLAATEKKLLWMIGLMALFYVAKTGAYVLVGYGDQRYHVETLCMLNIGALTALAILDKTLHRTLQKGVESVALGVAAASLVMSNIGGVVNQAVQQGNMTYLLQEWHAPGPIAALVQELTTRQVEPDDGILVLTNGSTGYEIGGYYPEWKVYVKPANPTWERIEYMQQEYMDVKFILLQSGWMEEEGMEDELNSRYSSQRFTVNEREYVLYALE